MHVNFMKYKWIYFGISFLVLIPGAFSLIRYGLRLSIDFTGGTLLEISNVQYPISNIQDIAKKQDLELSSVQASQDDTYLLRFKKLDKDQNEKFKSALGKDVIEKRYESVGPIVGAEMTKKPSSPSSWPRWLSLPISPGPSGRFPNLIHPGNLV